MIRSADQNERSHVAESMELARVKSALNECKDRCVSLSRAASETQRAACDEARSAQREAVRLTARECEDAHRCQMADLQRTHQQALDEACSTTRATSEAKLEKERQRLEAAVEDIHAAASGRVERLEALVERERCHAAELEAP
jgi:hypothetical protein